MAQNEIGPGRAGDLPGRRPLRRRRARRRPRSSASGASASTPTSTTSRSTSSRAPSRRPTSASTTRSSTREAGKFKGGTDIVFNLKNNGVGVGKISPKRAEGVDQADEHATRRRSSPASSSSRRRSSTSPSTAVDERAGSSPPSSPFRSIGSRRGEPTSLVLEMRGIRKEFPGVVANDDVDFDLRRGEVHALLGENGAGKSTLMNILYGLYQPDAGEIRLNGKPVVVRARRSDAIDAGIGMVHQHFMLIPVMTVAENIVLGTEPARDGVLLDERGSRAAGRARWRSTFNFAVDPDALVEDITRRPAAARRDPEGALPERRHPDPRRADRRADAAGGRGAVRDPPHAAAGGHVDHLHQPQAERGARDRRPHHRAAARQDDRDGARARARPRSRSPARWSAARCCCASRRRRRSRATSLLEVEDLHVRRRPRHREGARRLASTSGPARSSASRASTATARPS